MKAKLTPYGEAVRDALIERRKANTDKEGRVRVLPWYAVYFSPDFVIPEVSTEVDISHLSSDTKSKTKKQKNKDTDLVEKDVVISIEVQEDNSDDEEE